jgi:hypothetical protein
MYNPSGFVSHAGLYQDSAQRVRKSAACSYPGSRIDDIDLCLLGTDIARRRSRDRLIALNVENTALTNAPSAQVAKTSSTLSIKTWICCSAAAAPDRTRPRQKGSACHWRTRRGTRAARSPALREIRARVTPMARSARLPSTNLCNTRAVPGVPARGRRTRSVPPARLC